MDSNKFHRRLKAMKNNTHQQEATQNLEHCSASQSDSTESLCISIDSGRKIKQRIIQDEEFVNNTKRKRQQKQRQTHFEDSDSGTEAKHQSQQNSETDHTWTQATAEAKSTQKPAFQPLIEPSKPPPSIPELTFFYAED